MSEKVIYLELDYSQDNCPHDDIEEGFCIDCGQDCFDLIIETAEYACEGER